MPHRLGRRIADVLALDPAARALQYDGSWLTWGELGTAAQRVAGLVHPGARVGIMLRNRPALGYILGYGLHCFELYGLRT